MDEGTSRELGYLCRRELEAGTAITEIHAMVLDQTSKRVEEQAMRRLLAERSLRESTLSTDVEEEETVRPMPRAGSSRDEEEN